VNSGFFIYFLAYVVQSYSKQISRKIVYIIPGVLTFCVAPYCLAKDDEESSYPGIIQGQAALGIVQRA
jgi:hypothetical protein